jgi:hypothetical protein
VAKPLSSPCSLRSSSSPYAPLSPSAPCAPRELAVPELHCIAPAPSASQLGRSSLLHIASGRARLRPLLVLLLLAHGSRFLYARTPCFPVQSSMVSGSLRALPTCRAPSRLPARRARLRVPISHAAALHCALLAKLALRSDSTFLRACLYVRVLLLLLPVRVAVSTPSSPYGLSPCARRAFVSSSRAVKSPACCPRRRSFLAVCSDIGCCRFRHKVRERSLLGSFRRGQFLHVSNPCCLLRVRSLLIHRICACSRLSSSC